MVVDPQGIAAALKPKLRGVSHQWAFFVSLVAGAALIVAAPHAKATVAAAIYAATLSGLLGVSALYHRVNWSSVKKRMMMRRLDHAMIFLLIAGTYTPFALLVLQGPLAIVMLVVVWVGAGLGAISQMVWIHAPRWVMSVCGMALGWVAVAAMPQMADRMGLAAILMLSAGGALYTIGGIVYATKKPDPVPSIFGYHEIFHALVIAAAALQFAVVAAWALPAGA
ncbi:MAG: hemolysin III family protein [Solirubrobacteraceae bacterium]|nr:hemolysin III family protein [Solirubrobacteraceae bacterium]